MHSEREDVDDLVEIIPPDDHAPRIRACIAKYKARKPVFDRATWRPKVGDNVVLRKSPYGGVHQNGTVAKVVKVDPSYTHGAYLLADEVVYFHTYNDIEPA
jgi:hypothetical protein